MKTFETIILSLSLIQFIYSEPQQSPEINDQFNAINLTETKLEEKETQPDIIYNDASSTANPKPDIENKNEETTKDKQTDTSTNKNTKETNGTNLQVQIETTNFIGRYYIAIRKPIMDFIETPRVNIILKNIGTCIVNGVMEIISMYFPAPLIPLIASAAGTVIPFEPVVMLRKRMPVTSYRRAFNSAVNSFMGTFDRFKTSEEDPYMTRSFNRRFMKHKDNSVQEN